jgi:hypothetical protein
MVYAMDRVTAFFIIICCLFSSFNVHDFASEKVYLLNLNISVCFEAFGECASEVQVFKDTKVPKMACDWSTGYAIPG